MTTIPTQQTSHQFFYFYHAAILVSEVLGITMSILQQTNPHLIHQQPWLAVPEFVLGLFGVVIFVCTIVAFFVWKKKRYPGYTYVTPAVYLGCAVLMFGLGIVWSIQMMTTTFQHLGNNPDPAAIQQAMTEQSLPIWLYICSYATALITMIVTALVWMKFKRAADTTSAAPTK